MGTVSRDDITFGPLSPAEVEGIAQLITAMNPQEHNRNWLRARTAQYYRWIYHDNPAGPAIVFCARHEGRIVSTFAMAPKRMQIDGRELICGKTMDMFTDPGYQGLGLMSSLARMVFDASRAAGVHQWYVTPSPNSYPIFTRKWGYQEPFEVSFCMMPLRVSAVLAALSPVSVLGRIAGLPGDLCMRWLTARPAASALTVSPLDVFDDTADQLWQEVAAGYRVALVRDARYLNWRYVHNPDPYHCFGFARKGRLCAVVVLKYTLRRGIRIGEIVDVIADLADTALLDTLFGFVFGECFRAGCGVVESWGVAAARWGALLRRHGLKMTKKKRVKFLLSPDAAYPGWSDPDAWVLTQGDGNDI